MDYILITLSIIELGIIAFLLIRDLKRQDHSKPQEQLLNNILTTLGSKHDALAQILEKTERTFREEISRNREEMGTNLKNSSDVLASNFQNLSKLQSEQLNNFALNLKTIGEGSRNDLQQMRSTMETNLKSLQEDNTKKLEEMRKTVDEKLQTTLEQRISLSFQTVSERLELVHKGLGEMQTLAIGVGDLKKVLSNVKTRGTWGEVQLGNLLEQILSPDQYEANVQTKPGTSERVDFAIKLPGKDDNGNPVWLPIDAKFPQEDYQRLVLAQESGNLEESEIAIKQLENRIKLDAKSIRDKYIDPPHTTDFALLFLPTEGLYAEMIRRPGLMDKLQSECRINLVGPTTLAALLNSLQMGFRTLTIQKRSSEVWKYLAEVKKHFGTFGDLLAKAYEKVDQASKVIEDAGKRSRTIEAKLNKVGELSGMVETEPTDLLSALKN